MPRRSKNAHLEEISDEELEYQLEMHMDYLTELAIEEWAGSERKEDEWHEEYEDISWESLKGLGFGENFAKDFNERLIPLAENLVALARFYEENRRGNMALEKTGYPTKLADILANDLVDSLFLIFGIKFGKNQNLEKRRRIFEEVCIYLSYISKGWDLISLPKIETTFEKCIIDIIAFIIGNEDLFEFSFDERMHLLEVFETRSSKPTKWSAL